MLFAGSIADNIALGRPGADRDGIRDAARIAGVAPVIERLPRGYDTPIGELGTLLSGGQRRCVAVARAALLGAPIVILDEPTVGLDPEATEEVAAAVAALGRGRTVILITHDMATIPDDRRVIVLEGGRVVADGPKRALVAAGAMARLRLAEPTA
jgi:ABC-type bacteriocin/lantibiotic exporter with double-glycine peptidase domain